MMSEETTWRKRANDVADKLHDTNVKLERATEALSKIVHMGYVGDPHVDLAVSTLKSLGFYK